MPTRGIPRVRLRVFRRWLIRSKAKKWFRETLAEIKELKKETGLQNSFQNNNLTQRAEIK